MLVNIDKIVVESRIRKDYGDLQELADNISENTLMNPPVVTPVGDGTYLLIAGERRLRAMRDILGYMQTEVNVVTPRDAEQMLLMEISENECRKEFTMTERLDYAAKIKVVESAKAQERIQATQFGSTATPKSAEPEGKGETRDKVASSIGMGHEKMRQAQYVSDNRDLLDPADFAEWDEGRLSTNKAFRKIKAAQRQAEDDRAKAERERDMANRELDAVRRNLAEAYRDGEMRDAEVAQLKRQLAERPKPEVVEREVVREVVPDDYEETKKKLTDARRESERLNREYHEMWDKNRELGRKLEQANELLGVNDRMREANRDIEQLTAATNRYLRQYGGKAWAFDQFDRVDAITQEEFRKAITSLAAFAQNLSLMVSEARMKGIE